MAGLSPINASIRNFDRAADSPDVLDRLVGTRQAASDVKANIAVIKTNDEMLGSLLDIKA